MTSIGADKHSTVLRQKAGTPLLNEKMEQQLERYAILSNDGRLTVLRNDLEGETVTLPGPLINCRMKGFRSLKAQGKLSHCSLAELLIIEALVRKLWQA